MNTSLQMWKTCLFCFVCPTCKYSTQLDQKFFKKPFLFVSGTRILLTDVQFSSYHYHSHRVLELKDHSATSFYRIGNCYQRSEDEHTIINEIEFRIQVLLSSVLSTISHYHSFLHLIFWASLKLFLNKYLPFNQILHLIPFARTCFVHLKSFDILYFGLLV